MRHTEDQPRNSYWLLSEAEPARRWRANAPVKELARALLAHRRVGKTTTKTPQTRGEGRGRALIGGVS
jgi:hypothetical protein